MPCGRGTDVRENELGAWKVHESLSKRAYVHDASNRASKDDYLDDEDDDLDVKEWLECLGLPHLKELFVRVRIATLREARALTIDVSSERLLSPPLFFRPHPHSSTTPLQFLLRPLLHSLLRPLLRPPLRPLLRPLLHSLLRPLLRPLLHSLPLPFPD
eukprot:765454-Hanusia_phi.AAC.1